MSRIDDLIAEHCAAGVQRRPLGELATLVRGNGLPKADLTDSGVGAVHYGQIYTRYGTWADSTLSFVTPESAVRLAKVDPGDVIITNTSENVEDVGKALAWVGDEQIVTGGHATIIKHSMDPKFLAYLFQTPALRVQKRKAVTGTKVMEVSSKSLAKFLVPDVPLEVQREIVGVLDRFTQLEAELEAELEARRLQYTHYRDRLLTFDDADAPVRWLTIAELGTLFGGLTGKSKADFADRGERFVSYTNVFQNLAVDQTRDDFVRIGPDERQRALRLGDILFTGSSENEVESGMSSVVTNEPGAPLYLNSFSIGLRLNAPEALDPEFSKHLFRSGPMRAQIVRTASGVTRFNISKARLGKVRVPIPPLDEQRRIADTLDAFDVLVNDLSTGLPAELEARRTQYAHYRDRLLTFEPLAA